MNEEELKAVVDYFRNKAAELEMQNIELQLQIGRLAKEVADLKAEDSPTDESGE